MRSFEWLSMAGALFCFFRYIAYPVPHVQPIPTIWGVVSPGDAVSLQETWSVSHDVSLALSTNLDRPLRRGLYLPLSGCLHSILLDGWSAGRGQIPRITDAHLIPRGCFAVRSGQVEIKSGGRPRVANLARAVN